MNDNRGPIEKSLDKIALIVGIPFVALLGGVMILERVAPEKLEYYAKDGPYAKAMDECAKRLVEQKKKDHPISRVFEQYQGIRERRVKDVENRSVGLNSGNEMEYVNAMGSIDTSQCPQDFQESFVTVIDAERQHAAFLQAHTGIVGFTTSVLTGQGLNPSLWKEAQRVNSALESAWVGMSAVGSKYGLTLQCSFQDFQK